MEHGSQLVDLVDETGKPVGQKLRKTIDKTQDLYHSVHTMLITPWGEVILSLIPKRTDLPNIYANQLGAPVATIRRSTETPDQAAFRSLSRELFIDGPDVFHLGDRFHECDDGHRTFLSAYYMISMPPQTFSKTDIENLVVLRPNEFRKRLRETPERFAPTLRALWQTYEHQLPV